MAGMQVTLNNIVIMGRRALSVALLLCSLGATGCQLIRIPLPALNVDVNVFEEQRLPGFVRLINTETRLGVFGLELPLPKLCDLGDAELIARAYMNRFIEEEVGELANNIDVQSVGIKEIRLTALEGDFAFLSDAGIRLTSNDQESTLWSRFLDRPERKQLVFEADGDFNLFNLLPGQDECVQVALMYSGTYPDESIVVRMDLVLEVQVDWRF
jgi:hypothetical protein